MSVATRVGLAEDYLKNAVSRLWAPMGYNYGFSSTQGHPPTSKVLAFVRARDVDCIKDPIHMGNKGEAKEKIITSARLSDFDPGTQGLIRAIFGETDDPEYIEQ
ncbi:hypothetical protein KA016_02975 [Candidatus Saccharibacteria bacterium]|jgi:hypothetical protein|nr:hypothetical protein [Candidatus Saccharibacteria bacterium]